jgi:hypothetical protein
VTKGNGKAKKGRPRGPKTVRFSALLYPVQLDTLELIAEELEGTPKVTGLVRTAVQQYIDHKLAEKDLRDRVNARRAGLHLVS